MSYDIDIQDPLGHRVLGVVSIQERANSVVVLSHGYSSNKNSSIYREIETELNSQGLGTVRYDYYGHGPAYGFGPGYGASDDVTVSKCVGSLRGVVNYLQQELGDVGIGLLGSSFGGLLSIIVASKDERIKALALKSPVTEPKTFWRQRVIANFGETGIDKWRRDGRIHYKDRIEDYDLRWDFWQDLQNYDTLTNAQKIRCPTMIVHGDNDTYVPIQQSQELAAALGGRVHIVKGADHGYQKPEQYDEVKKLLETFLVEVLAHEFE